MTEFKPWPSGIKINRSTNRATTTALIYFFVVLDFYTRLKVKGRNQVLICARIFLFKTNQNSCHDLHIFESIRGGKK